MPTDDSTDETVERVRRPITGRDLARTLGISQSTISRAFSDGAVISPKMRALVLDAARDLGYHPNVIARSLTTRKSGIVGIITANMTNPFYTSILQPLAGRLQQLGLQTLITSIPSGQQIDSQLRLLLQYNVDAIVIMTGTVSPEMVRHWTDAGRTALLFSYSIPELDLVSITCDNEAGGRDVGRLLLQQGHRRPAFVGRQFNPATTRARARGFETALAEAGVPLFGRLDENEYTYEGGYAAALELGRTRPDAIFFAHDIMAIGGMDALRYGLGMRIPEDISVVGFDNIPQGAWPTYQLTTFAQPTEAMVDAAVHLLTAGGRDADKTAALVQFPGSLVQRGSVRSRAR